MVNRLPGKILVLQRLCFLSGSNWTNWAPPGTTEAEREWEKQTAGSNDQTFQDLP
jgi:hypothetical protein